MSAQDTQMVNFVIEGGIVINIDKKNSTVRIQNDGGTKSIHISDVKVVWQTSYTTQGLLDLMGSLEESLEKIAKEQNQVI